MAGKNQRRGQGAKRAPGKAPVRRGPAPVRQVQPPAQPQQAVPAAPRARSPASRLPLALVGALAVVAVLAALYFNQQSRAGRAALEQQSASYEARLDDLGAERDRLQQEVEQMRSDLSNANASLQQTEASLVTLNQEREAFETFREDAEQRGLLSQELNQLQDRIDAANEQLQVLEARRDDLSREGASAAAAADAARRDEIDIRTRLAALTARLAQREAELGRVSARLDQVQQDLAERDAGVVGAGPEAQTRDATAPPR